MSATASKTKSPQPTAAQSPEIMTAEEAADFLRLPLTSLLRQTREGHIPGAKIGRTWRFSRRLLLEWLEDASLPEDDDLAQIVLERVAAKGKKIPLAEMKKRFGL